MITFRIPVLLAKKRDGIPLTPEEIEYFIKGVTCGSIQDVQIGAMLMAIFLNGMTDTETAALTKAMLHSGTTLQWPADIQPLVADKHSTGGVGDKISIILAPALAACGLKVPMISGRGLGFTGGTIDKLESIPGYRATLSAEEALETIRTVGCFIMAASECIAPADKILYASRDVTSTVESIPLITASILSKKAAENLSAFLLDLKCGRAAFIKDIQTAKVLADLMVKVGTQLGIRTAVVITKMDCPLGKKIGNGLEIAESIDTLKGHGPRDIENLVVLQGGVLLHLMGLVNSEVAGETLIRTSLHNGSALAKFEDMLVAQGVKRKVAHEMCSDPSFPHLQKSRHITDLVFVGKPGNVKYIDALELGIISGELGAGRSKVGEAIDPAVGLELLVSVGEFVTPGQVWIRIHHNSAVVSTDHLNKLQNAICTEEPMCMEKAEYSQIIDIIY